MKNHVHHSVNANNMGGNYLFPHEMLMMLFFDHIYHYIVSYIGIYSFTEVFRQKKKKERKEKEEQKIRYHPPIIIRPPPLCYTAR